MCCVCNYAIARCARGHTRFEPARWVAGDACLQVSSQPLYFSSILTSAPRVDHFLPYPTFTWQTTRSLQTVFAFTWSFSAETDTLFIDNNTSLELHPEQQQFNTVTVDAKVNTGELDGISLPWFNMADAALMTSGFFPAHASLSLQLVRRRVAGDAPTYDVFTVPILKDTSHLPPLLTISYPNPATESKIPIFTFPQLPHSTSPSTTLPIRRAIVYCLAPVVFVASFAADAAMVVAQILFWVSIIWLLWAFAFGSSKNWRSGFVEPVPPAVLSEVGVDVNDKGVDGICDSKECAVVPELADSMV